VNGAVLLLSAALIVRTWGAAARIAWRQSLWRAVGWVLCALAGWLAAAAAGALFPLWPVLVLGIAGALLDLQGDRQELWSGADAIVVVVSGLFSVPRVEATVLIEITVLATAVGFAVDSLLRQSPKRVRVGTLVMLFLACISIGMARFPSIVWGASLLQEMSRNANLLEIGIVPVCQGERIVLETGAVAWLERPPGEGPFPGALLFHGAHPDGSRQPSAIVLRRALLDAGFVVLSVDHPGYGESHAPSVDADIVAWDPMPTVLAALKTLRATKGVDGIFAFGHSLGATDVLRLSSVEPMLRGAAIFGAALGESIESGEIAEYWYKRFHTDRRMNNWLTRERFLEIGNRFYDEGRLVKALHPDHAPILFVQFGFEHSNIAATRDALYDAIPGRKMRWDLVNSTHYFSSHKVAGLVIGDTQVARSLASRLRLLPSEFSMQQVAGYLDKAGTP